MIPLKFGDEPSTTAAIAYKNDESAATVRFEDEKRIGAGDEIQLQYANAEPFSEGVVRRVITCPVHDVMTYIRQLDVNYHITSQEKLVSALNYYYDEPIHIDTEVKIIVYEVMEWYDDS